MIHDFCKNESEIFAWANLAGRFALNRLDK